MHIRVKDTLQKLTPGGSVHSKYLKTLFSLNDTSREVLKTLFSLYIRRDIILISILVDQLRFLTTGQLTRLSLDIQLNLMCCT